MMVKAAGMVLGLFALGVGIVVTTFLVRIEKERRAWVVNRAVDEGSCSATRHVYLKPPTPPGSREIFAATIACRAQIVRMLNSAPNFACSVDEQLTVCEHPLNSEDSTTYVRAILHDDHVLLETIPT